jgi:hypothetical protein
MTPRSLLLSFVLTAAPAAAQSVFVQPMSPNGGTLRASQLWIDPTGQNDSDNDAIAWENFQLPEPVTITRVAWWGDPAPSLGFRIEFFEQDPGTVAVQPWLEELGGTPFGGADYPTVSQTAVGGGLYRIEAQLAVPQSFAASTRYFVAITGRTPQSFQSWRWAQGTNGSLGTFWWQRGAHMYFHLPDDRALELFADGGAATGTPYCFGDGGGTACPCANHSAPGAGEGCLNSLGQGGKLVASGAASVAHDGLVLSAAQLPDGFALFFQGTSQAGGGIGVVTGDGLRCAGGTLIRLGAKPVAGGTASWPGPGDPTVSAKGLLAGPATRTYQAWYRNPAPYCTSATYNLTNGVLVAWAP